MQVKLNEAIGTFKAGDIVTVSPATVEHLKMRAEKQKTATIEKPKTKTRAKTSKKEEVTKE